MKTFSLGAALFLFCTAAHAQIIYTDVVPDSVYNSNGDTCFLDVNNDGTTDYTIRYYLKAGAACAGCSVGPPLLHPSWVKADPLNTNAMADTVVGPAALITGRSIDASLAWGIAPGQVLASIGAQCVGTTPTLCVPYSSSGDWVDDSSSYSPRYLGLRFEAGGSTYYGWAHLHVATNDPLVVSYFTLKDYAYNSVPDEFILAGDTGSVISTGVAQLAHSSVQVSPNPFTSMLSVHIGAGHADGIACRVRTLLGVVCLSTQLEVTGGRTSFTLDLAALAPGAYLLEVLIDGERVVRKVMKE